MLMKNSKYAGCLFSKSCGNKAEEHDFGVSDHVKKLKDVDVMGLYEGDKTDLNEICSSTRGVVGGIVLISRGSAVGKVEISVGQEEYTHWGFYDAYVEIDTELGIVNAYDVICAAGEVTALHAHDEQMWKIKKGFSTVKHDWNGWVKHTDEFFTVLRCGNTGWIGDFPEDRGIFLADSLIKDGEDFASEAVKSAGRTIAGVIENCDCNGATIRGWGGSPWDAAGNAMEVYEEDGGFELVARWFEEVWDADLEDIEDEELANVSAHGRKMKPC